MQTLFENATLFRADPDRPAVVETEQALFVDDGLIEWIGPANAIPAECLESAERRDLNGLLVTPSLIDCHTHLIWGGSREAEFVQRLAGVKYEDILARGGGIHSTVRATRAASSGTLFEDALPRLEEFRRQGVTTVEIKSGYGLTTKDELRILEVIRDLDGRSQVELVPTFLGAHAVPEEFKGNRNEYVRLVCEEMIPAVAESGLAMAVDVFAERGAFSVDEMRRVFEAAHSHGLHFKAHAEQLSHTGAARAAGELGALSADHLEYLDERGIAAMRAGDTVAVLLPGSMLSLNAPAPPVAKLRAAGIPMAISTDCNPGSSHTTNLHLMMSLACLRLGLSPEEALLGVTRHAAKALGLQNRIGSIAVGHEADLCIWNCQTVAAIPYHLGSNLVLHAYKHGRRML
ncbi:imidazolonepropionase [Candidatus Poribacteria bacterium]|nr:imidazolonepropionase [Candidatus Poribacteria bacterium]